MNLRREIVENPQRIACCQQFWGEMRSDESGTTRDKNDIRHIESVLIKWFRLARNTAEHKLIVPLPFQRTVIKAGQNRQNDKDA